LRHGFDWNIISPVNATTTRLFSHKCYPAASLLVCFADKAAERGIDSASICPNSEQVMDENVDICELVQRKLAPGFYPGGRLSASRESGTVCFQ